MMIAELGRAIRELSGLFSSLLKRHSGLYKELLLYTGLCAPFSLWIEMLMFQLLKYNPFGEYSKER